MPKKGKTESRRLAGGTSPKQRDVAQESIETKEFQGPENEMLRLWQILRRLINDGLSEEQRKIIIERQEVHSLSEIASNLGDSSQHAYETFDRLIGRVADRLEPHPAVDRGSSSGETVAKPTTDDRGTQGLSEAGSKALVLEPKVGQTASVEGELGGQDERVRPNKETINELFDGLPSQPKQRLAAIRSLYRQIRQRAKAELRPTISSLLSELPESYAGKVELAREVNAVLHDAGLALKDPRTGMPATLLAHRPRETSPASSLRLQDTSKGEDEKRNRLTIDDLEAAQRNFELTDISSGTSISRQRNR